MRISKCTALSFFWNCLCFWLFSRGFFEFWSHFFEIFWHKLDCLFLKKLRLSAHVKKWKCGNIREKVSPASWVLSSVRHRYSGICFSPLPLITDYSDSAQLWIYVQCTV
jgi:hypothetical protein